jgi:hypothetical protein
VAHALVSRRHAAPWLDHAFVLANTALLAITLLAPNPLDPAPLPPQIALRAETFPYFFVVLARAAFGLSPRLMLWSGAAVAAVWIAGTAWIAARPDTIVGFGRLHGAAADLVPCPPRAVRGRAAPLAVWVLARNGAAAAEPCHAAPESGAANEPG